MAFWTGRKEASTCFYQFLIENRETLLAHTVAKNAGPSEQMPTSAEARSADCLDFYDLTWFKS